MYRRINDHVYTEIDLSWSDAIAEYLQTFDLRGLAAASKYEAEKTLTMFDRFCHPRSTAGVNQAMVDAFILDRQAQVKSNYTVNSTIQRLKTFLTFLQRRHYHPGGIDLVAMKTSAPVITALSNDQIRQIFDACPTIAWRCRILLSLTTGMRKRDIDELPITAIDLDMLVVNSKALKTGKVRYGRPLPDRARAPLKALLSAALRDQVGLFDDRNVRKTWDRIRIQLDFTVTRQQLRQTFATMVQTIAMPTAQNLLDHSDQRITDRFYTDRDLVERWKVNQLPVGYWLGDNLKKGN